ncbi:hypothetical protein D9M73_93450 [compost metagenome]
MRQAAIRHRGGGVDLARPGRQRGTERARQRPVRRVLEHADIGDIGSGRADKGLIFGADIAQRPGQRHVRPGPREIPREDRVRFELNAFDRRLGGVGGDAAEGLDPADDAADRSRHLHIAIVRIEAVEREGQALVEQRALPADLIALHHFGLEQQIVVDFLIAAHAILIDVGGRGARPARIEPAALKAFRIRRIKQMVGGRLEAQRGARGEAFEIGGAAEIGRWRADQRRIAAEFRGHAEIAGLEDIGLALVPGIAPAQRQAPLRREIIGEIAEDRAGFGPHVARSIGVEVGQRRRQEHVEAGRSLGPQIIEADQAVELVALISELEFLAGLFVAINGRHIDIDRRQCVEIDRREGAVLAERADAFQRQMIAQFAGRDQRQPARLDVLARAVEPGARIKRIGLNRRRAGQAGDQPRTVARVRFVLGVIAGQPQRHPPVGRGELDRAAPGPDVLVIIVDVEIGVAPEAVARQPRAR